MQLYHPKQIQSIIEQTPKTLVGIFVSSFLLVLFYYQSIPIFYVFFWISLQILFISLRILNMKNLQKAIDSLSQATLKHYVQQFLLLMWFSSIIWNIAVIYIELHVANGSEYVMIIIILGLTTGAILAVSPLYNVYFTYVLFMLVPQVVVFYSFGDINHLIVLVYLFIYILMVAFLSKSFFGSQVKMINYTDQLNLQMKQLHTLSVTDELTKIYNRRYFFDMATKYLSLSRREEKPLSFIMLDIDFFKQVNDKYGHVVGDFILVELSNIIQKRIRESDVFARLGGEEFAVLLNNASSKDSKRIANEFRIAIEENIFEVENYKVKITISLGVSFLSDKVNKIELLYKEADRRLYLAKKRGRNCVV